MAALLQPARYVEDYYNHSAYAPIPPDRKSVIIGGETISIIVVVVDKQRGRSGQRETQRGAGGPKDCKQVWEWGKDNHVVRFKACGFRPLLYRKSLRHNSMHCRKLARF
eukprot:4940313-Pleurochrysis_carterae.AAC.3